MKKVLFLLLGLILLLLATKFALDYVSSKNVFFPVLKKQSIIIKGVTFTVEIAKTPKEQEVGLSEKTSLPNDKGMLFVFEKPGFYSFWMKNMKLPIDILFINNNKIVTIFENAQPPTSSLENLQIYSPSQEADKTLEINAGTSKKYGIQVGDEIKIQ